MTISEIIEFILLPAIGWLLLNSNKSEKRLTRIETMLKILLPDHPKHKKNEE